MIETLSMPCTLFDRQLFSVLTISEGAITSLMRDFISIEHPSVKRKSFLLPYEMVDNVPPE